MEANKEKLRTIIELSTKATNMQWRQVFNNLDTKSIEEKKNTLGKGARVVWFDHEKLAYDALFCKDDCALAKQHFFTCGMLDLYLILELKSNLTDYGLSNILYAFFSDSTPLISYYASLGHSNFSSMQMPATASPVVILQSIVLEDWQLFENAIKCLTDKLIPKEPVFELDRRFYLALAEKKESEVYEIIHEFLSPKIHKKRNKHNLLLGEFMSMPVAGYLKLAWIKGVEIEVKNDLIPMQIMPIKPLKEYKIEYNFLNGVLPE